MTYTNYSAIIKYKGMTESFLQNKNRDSFYLASQIKKEIHASDIYIDQIQSDRIKYFHVNGLSPCKHKKVHCVDINGAYPNTIHKMGFITKELLNKMMHPDVEKMTRLKAIGQIATKKTRYTYLNGRSVGKPEILVDKYLRNIWFALCHEVGETIDRCKKYLVGLKTYLFFWFDGIYFKRKSAAKKVIQILSESGYTSKLETLIDFTVRKEGGNLLINYKKGDTLKPKAFNLPMVEAGVYN